jgi:hypothetical protein
MDKMNNPEDISQINGEGLRVLQGRDPTLTAAFQKAEDHIGIVENDIPGGQFFVKNGLLYRRGKVTLDEVDLCVSQLVLPSTCRKKVLLIAHDIPMSGHLSYQKTLDRVIQRFFWPGIYKDVKNYCESCGICQKTCLIPVSHRVPLMNLPIIDTPFKRVAIDIAGPLQRSKSGFMYILVLCDYATRYPEAIPLKNIGSKHVAEELVKIFSRVGIPEEILSDCGSNFMSQLLEEVYALLGVSKIKISPYHKQSDGLTERFIGTLKRMLRKYVEEEPKMWDKWLPYLLFAYREVPQASTGFSPFELLYGRRVRGPLDIVRSAWEEPENCKQSSARFSARAPAQKQVTFKFRG